MTAQITDIFLYHGSEYSLVGISEGELLDPANLGLNPVMASTACWRGYQAVYGISDSQLVLSTLHVNLPIGGPEIPIEGVKPTGSRDTDHLFNNHYDGLNCPLEYTGGLLLGDGFIWDLYVHMGFHPAWKFMTVIELVFDNGILINEYDRTGRMAEIRQRVEEFGDDQKSGGMPSDEELREFVDDAFDRTYKM